MMPPDPQQLEELLSGMLDGVLSEDEQRQLESAMQNDPSIALRLEELAELRRSLLRGRSVGRLGPDFSKRILQAAQERAESLESPPAWILPNHPNAVPAGSESSPSIDFNSDFDYESKVHESARHSTFKRTPNARPVVAQTMLSNYESSSATLRDRVLRFWGPSLLAVVAFGALFFSLPKLAPVDPSASPITVSGNPVESDPDPIQSDPSGVKTIGPSTSNVASAPTKTLPQTPAIEVPKEGGLAAEEKMLNNNTSSVATSPAPNQDGSVNPSAFTNAEPKETEAKKEKELFTLVAEVHVDPVADEQQMLNQLLEQYELIVASDLNLDRAQIDALVASKIIGSPDAGAATNEASLYFLKAKDKQIDGFLVTLQSQYKDFPYYQLNLTTDKSVKALINQLAMVSDGSTGAPAAHRLTFRDELTKKEVNEFPSMLEGNGMDLGRRKASKDEPAMNNGLKNGPGKDGYSYLILLVRQAQ
jgi:anti-sigma factor RsiW